ncbi:MAG: ABC transporter ATP-binding protein [Clostridia bacterium]|nr:ABC transporter ATP-binding protein [Clostridia bacterium]
MIWGRHINKYYLKHGPMLLLGLFALIMVDYFQLEIPRLYKYVINGMNDGAVEIDGVRHVFNMDFVLEKICIPMIITILVLVVGRFLWRLCFFGSAIKVETDLRNRMFDHCKDLSVSYYGVNKVGNMMSLFTNDLETVHECFGMGVMMFFDALFLGFLAVMKMGGLDPFLALLSMIPMIFLMCIAAILSKYMRKKWTIRQEAFSEISDFSQESFSGIAVVKAFVKEGVELWRFKKLNEKNERANVTYTKYSVLLKICVTLFVESVICVILGYGGYLVYTGMFNAGELIEFIGYFTSVVWPVMAVAELIELSSRGRASLDRISDLLEAPIDVKDSPDAVSKDDIKGKIEFKHLDFKYPGSEVYALKDVNFTIESGENVGIVGKTGAGKTTIVDLILRAYNVGDGMLFIVGEDVNSLKIKDVRGACAYVPQDNFLFSDTIANNIGFGADEVNADEVKNAAILSHVDDNIVEFKDGYETVLGERGVTVSGGQKQRISIARALMKNSPILILDDSVSAVDTKTEEVILRNLKNTRKGKTTILIAHRISTVEKMDKIVFVDDGGIEDVGTHEELYERFNKYRCMVELQRLESEGGNE